MRLAKSCLVSVAILWPSVARAQTVDGVVLDHTTRQPVEGATVILVRPSGDVIARVQTDTSGRFVALAVDSRQIIIKLEHPLYPSFESATIAIRSAERVTVSLHMARGAVPLEPLVVTARTRSKLAAFRDRAAHGAGWGHFITRSEIYSRGETRPTELLRNVHQIDLAPTAHCFGCTPTNLIYVRTGGSRCLATLYVNGIRVRQKEARGNVPGDFSVTIDELIPSGNELEGVEVYAQGVHAPSDLAPTDNCGVVAFWSRESESIGRFTWRKLAIGLGSVAALVALVR